MGSADFQKAPKNHVAWYHVQWFHRFHESHENKTQIFFWKALKLHTSNMFSIECGKLHEVADRFRHTPSIKTYNLLRTLQLSKFFNSNILSLEFAGSCLPWTWWQDLLSALSSRAAITSMEAWWCECGAELSPPSWRLTKSEHCKHVETSFTSKLCWINGFGDSYGDRNI